MLIKSEIRFNQHTNHLSHLLELDSASAYLLHVFEAGHDFTLNEKVNAHFILDAFLDVERLLQVLDVSCITNIE